jgi:hypothetical protein
VGRQAKVKQPWRKLSTAPTSDWTRLSLLSRGVGVELYRAADDTGRISLGGESAVGVVCRLLAAHPRERRRVADALDELSVSGWLTCSAGAIHVHVGDASPTHGAPGADPVATRSASIGPTSGALRAREAHENDAQRAPQLPEADVKPTRSAPEVPPKSAQPLNGTRRALSEREDREEERREDQSRSDAGASAGVREGVEHLYREWRRITGAVPGAGSVHAVVEVLTHRGTHPRQVHGHAERVKLVLDAAALEPDPIAWLTRAIEGFSRNAYAKRSGLGFELFASKPGSYAVAGPSHPSATSDFTHATDTGEF